MSLIYSFVARGTNVLAEYSFREGNLKEVALQCLENCPVDGRDKFTYTCDNYTFNFVVRDGYSYVIVAEVVYGREVAFACLERIRDEFTRDWAPRSTNYTAYSLNGTFGYRLREHMNYCMAHPGELTKVTLLREKVEEVQYILNENIENVLKEDKKINLYVEQKENKDFLIPIYGKRISLTRWLPAINTKTMVCMALIILLIVIIVFLSVCFSGTNCFNR